MKQQTLAQGADHQEAFEKYRKPTRRDEFLATMDRVVPWAELCAVVEPFYPKAGNGRPPVGLERMLRMTFVQHWFNLADEACEEALLDSTALRRLVGIDLELKINVTEPESAKMATSKAVIQGYAAQAAVDAKKRVKVAADVIGSGSEQQALLPMIESANCYRTERTLITADAGYHSDENLTARRKASITAMIADNNGMRSRDERFAQRDRHKEKPDPLYDKSKTVSTAQTTPKRFGPEDFKFDLEAGTCVCPAGKELYRSGSNCRVKRRLQHKFKGTVSGCLPCALRDQCLRTPEKTRIRQVAIFLKGQPSPMTDVERMKQAIDSTRGRRLCSGRMGTVEPVFGNLRHNKRLNRFALRGRKRVGTQWRMYCLVHNIERIAAL